MGGSSTYPGKYLQLNTSKSKQLNLVVTIAGVPGFFSVVPIYQKVTYGDPRLKYGLPGLVYGGLIVVQNVRSWIMWDSNVTISQMIEPEQGRGSVSTMTLKFIDYDGFMSQLISPGVIIPELLGNALVTVQMGYTNSAFPDDYFQVFRGFVSATTSGSGWVQLELSDANIKTRQDICYGGITELALAVATTDSVLSLGSASSFFLPVPDVNGDYDWALTEFTPLCSITGGATFTANTSSSSSPTVLTNIIPAVSTLVINNGQPISGPGIPGGATVVSSDPIGNAVTISASATATAANVAVVVTGSDVITVISGMPAQDLINFAIAGPGIPPGSTILSHTTSMSTSFTISNNALSSSAGTLVDCVTLPSDAAQNTVRAFIMIDSEWMEYGALSLSQGASLVANMSSSSSPTVLTDIIPAVTSTNVLLGSLLQALGIPANTVVTDFDVGANTITMSAAATITQNSASVNLTPFANVFRGGQFSRGTEVAEHDALTQVTNAIQLQGNVIDIILKLYLSGWGGPWITGISCVALGTTIEPGVLSPSAIVFPVDVVETYGLVPGDQIQISGSIEGNNGNVIIVSIADDEGGDPNRIVYCDTNFTLENPASAVSLAFRSQYDTLPTTAGLSNTPQDIDVAGFLDAQRTYFGTGQFNVQLFIQDSITGKDFIEQELFLPFGSYSVTRQGKLSIAVTSPPLLNQKLVQLDETNVINPQNTTIVRALNNRRFYNLVQYSFDVDDSGDFLSQVNLLDADSETRFNQTQSLPIPSNGLRSSLGGEAVVASRGTALLNRFKNAAYQITLSVNWEAGSQIEAGDVVVIQDPDTLQITNFDTGERGLGTQLFEVIGRTLKPQNGSADLTLLSSLGYTVGQRYATISPSSIVGVGSTTAAVIITDSYGPLYPGNEQKKYAQLIGCTLTVHAPDYSYSSSAVLVGFDPANPYRMLLATALTFTPSAGDVVDVASYGTGTDPSFNAEAKLLFCFIDPSLTVVSGTNQTTFTVSSGDAAQMNVGQPITIHNADYSILSNEVNVLSIVGTTITTADALGMVPAAGQTIEGVGFKDGGSPYRLV